MTKFIIILIFTIEIAYAAGTIKLIDFMISSSGTVEVLSKYGIKGKDAKLVESYLSTSLSALGSKKSITKSELLGVISKLPVTGKDATVRKELQVLLDKSEGELKKEDIVTAVNHIIYLANRHGKSIVITCTECVNENLTKNGFKFTVENIKKISTKKILDEVIPNNPIDLQNYISSRMRRLGLGDYSKVTPGIIAPEEEKSFALFLGLMENGSPDIKKLIESVKKISTKNRKVNLIDSSNPNKFWKVAINDMSPEEIESWTKTLNEVSLRANKEKISPEDAFYKILKEKSEGNELLVSKYKLIKLKRCFFK
jgi:predicted Zn-ribbon and HTH transcriptional regulator